MLCKQFGHIAWNCTLDEEPVQSRKEVAVLQQGVSLFQKYNTDEVINKTWILLDSCSTDTVFKNPDLVANIRTGSADEELRMLTNGGSVTYKDVADCKLLPLKVHLTRIPWRMFFLSNKFSESTWEFCRGAARRDCPNTPNILRFQQFSLSQSRSFPRRFAPRLGQVPKYSMLSNSFHCPKVEISRGASRRDRANFPNILCFSTVFNVPKSEFPRRFAPRLG